MVKAGEWVDTPRFLKVKIKEIFESEEAARKAGYTEPTHLHNGEFGVNGKSLDLYHMEFAAYPKG